MSNLSIKIGDGAERKDGTKGKVGTVSVIGLQSFPVTLYESQWRQLANVMPGIVKFLDANKDNPHLVTAREAKPVGKTGTAHKL